MTKSELYRQELEKIKLSLDTFEKKNRVSSILLFRHYLNNLYLCKLKLGYDNRVIKGKSKKYHNLFLDIHEEWTKELKSQDEFNDDLDRLSIKVKGGRYYDDIFIYLFVYWNVYRDLLGAIEGEVNPYEPVIKIIQRGSDIYSLSGELQIDEFTLNYFPKYYTYNLPSLEYNFLDFIDKRSKGIADIPNQEQTNQLWEEFQAIEGNG